MAKELNDAGSERVVIAGVLSHGADGLIEVEEILSSNDFSLPHNQKIFSVLRHLVHDRDVTEFDIPTVMAALSSQGYTPITRGGQDEDFIASLFEESPSIGNAIKCAAIVYKLSLARRGAQCVRGIDKSLLKVDGSESISDILGLVENPVFAFSSEAMRDKTDMVPIGEGYAEAIQKLMETPQDIVGVPTGFQQWDIAIGGCRPGSINVVAARPKTGKSIWALNVAFNIAHDSKIPCLILDTELSHRQQQLRLASLISGVAINRIETGQCVNLEAERESVLEAEKTISQLPITYCSIAGQPLQSVLSLVRRWLVKTVGLGPGGKANPCMVLYDYIKLMDAREIRNNLAEFQILGFLLTEMHNFALRYGVPVIATAQMNREGATAETSEVIAGSDRMLWLCSSMTLLKKKSTEELNNTDPPINGNMKLVVTDTRNGMGLEPDTYIRIQADLARMKMKENGMFHPADAKIVLNHPVSKDD